MTRPCCSRQARSASPPTQTRASSLTPKLFEYFLSVAVLRGLSAECMLKAIDSSRSGSCKHVHNRSKLYQALDGKAKGYVERLANSHGVACPRRALKRYRNDSVEWRYLAAGLTDDERNGIQSGGPAINAAPDSYRRPASVGVSARPEGAAATDRSGLRCATHSPPAGCGRSLPASGPCRPPRRR